MAVIRDNILENNAVDYFATAALFCGIAATIIMLKFRGFRAIINIATNDKQTKDVNETPATTGVYRVYKEEFFGNGSLPDPPKKITPSMVRLPSATPGESGSTTLVNSKSVPDVRTPSGSTVNDNRDLSKSTVDVSNKKKPAIKKIDPKVAKNQEKELKKLEKQRLDEQKKIEKKAKADAQKEAKEKAAREVKLKKEREKAEKERLKEEATMKAAKGKSGKKPKSTAAGSSAPPAPPPPPPAQDAAVTVRVTNPLAKAANPLANSTIPQAKPSQGYTTNTLESSISRSSGPPPYTKKETPETVPNQSDNSGNVSFGKPIEAINSWEFISEHRHQMNRPVNPNPVQRKKATTLEYSVGNKPKLAPEDNSEA